MSKRKLFGIVFISVFTLVTIWPKDIHPKLYLISLFIHDEESYQKAEVYCSKYKQIYKRDYCRSYITEKYIGKK